MAKKKPKSDAEEPEESEGGSGKRNLIIGVVGLVGVAYFMGLGPFASADPPLAEGVEVTTTTIELHKGTFVNVPEATVNLSGGPNFLKYGMTLVLRPGLNGGDIETRSALALDIANDFFAAMTIEDLQQPSAREDAKAELTKLISEAYDGDVARVLLPRFTYQ